MSVAIPVNTPLLAGNELKYITESITSGWISSEGPFVQKFESQFSSYVNRRYGVAVANGSAALDIAIQALHIGEGDEVIMPTFTIISPALSVIRAGAVPVLIDSAPTDWTMDETQIEAKITSRTKAILIVHVYGIPANMSVILDIARKHNLLVIEDAAEMIGQTFNGQPCGSFGDISVFSFYANKHITTGEGGMLVTNDEQLAERCMKLRNLGFEKAGPRFVHYEMGWNYRLTNLQAAIGLAQLEQIEGFLEKKRMMGNYYQEQLSFLTEKGFTLPVKDTENSENIYWVFGLVGPDADITKQLTDHLTSEKIGWRPFFWCIHEQPVFREMNLFANEKYSHAEVLARQGFYIPGGLGLNMDEMTRVTTVIKDFFN